MTIQTLRHQYYVIRRIRKTTKVEQYLCREETDEKKKKRFDIFRIREKELAKRLVLFYNDQISNTAFRDFYECFTQDGDLYMVFRHRQAVSLIDKMETEGCGFKERLAIGKKILERLLLLNIPDILAYDVLKADTVQVTKTLDVYFQYTLQEIDKIGEITRRDVFHRLAVLMETLFSREISLEITRRIPKFVAGLREGEYEDLSEVYEAYTQMTRMLEGEMPAARPHTFLFRVWEAVKSAWKKISPLLKKLLIIALIFYIIYSLLFSGKEEKQKYDFSRIGTLEITEKGGEPEGAEGE